MPEWRRLGVIGFVVREAIEQAFVKAKGLMKIAADLFALLFRIAAIEVAGFGDKRVEPFGGVHC